MTTWGGRSRRRYQWPRIGPEAREGAVELADSGFLFRPSRKGMKYFRYTFLMAPTPYKIHGPAAIRERLPCVHASTSQSRVRRSETLERHIFNLQGERVNSSGYALESCHHPLTSWDATPDLNVRHQDSARHDLARSLALSRWVLRGESLLGMSSSALRSTPGDRRRSLGW